MHPEGDHKGSRKAITNQIFMVRLKQLNRFLENCDQCQEHMHVSECPEVGTVSQGRTIEEALVNLKEATKLCLEEFPMKETLERSFVTNFEVGQVAKT